MKFFICVLSCFLQFLSPLNSARASDASDPVSVSSPDGQLSVQFRVAEKGQPVFEAAYNKISIVTGSLGLELAGSPAVQQFEQVGVRRATKDETYAIPVGKTSSARDHHNEAVISLVETRAPHRKLDIAFRVFDDGIAFRYLLPEQKGLDEFILIDEHTRLTFADDPRAKALPLSSYQTSYEWYYETKPVSQLRPDQLIGLPMLLEHPQKIWLAITEANLKNYAGMYLAGVTGKPGTFTSRLSPLLNRKDGAKVIGKPPFASPWRILMVADAPGQLIESNLVFHLNEPSAIKDPSWIKPGKTTFPWWNHYVLEDVDFKPGVNTETMKQYIDFCAQQGIPYHSLDGLDIAWYGGPIAPSGPTDVTRAASSIDMPALLRYAQEKGVRLRLWMHWKALKPQLDEAFRTYEQWGIEGVMIDFMDRDDQEMVAWYHEVASKAAQHHLTVTWHGAYKPTGMERTWPNVLTYEAALNQEYNKWQPPGVKGTPPEHNLDIAFVRMLAGPLDYHQGGMRNVLPQHYAFRDVAPPVQGTRAHQLAMYVVYQNHLPMMADYPQAYQGQPGLRFMVQVPASWDETRVLHAELGTSIVIARRKGNVWYLGGMSANNKQNLELELTFLGEGSFEADVYEDDPAAGATALTYRKQVVAATDALRVAMSPSGGFAARLQRREP